jgi:hypothetical protein
MTFTETIINTNSEDSQFLRRGVMLYFSPIQETLDFKPQLCKGTITMDVGQVASALQTAIWERNSSLMPSKPERFTRLALPVSERTNSQSANHACESLAMIKPSPRD